MSDVGANNSSASSGSVSDSDSDIRSLASTASEQERNIGSPDIGDAPIDQNDQVEGPASPNVEATKGECEEIAESVSESNDGVHHMWFSEEGNTTVVEQDVPIESFTVEESNQAEELIEETDVGFPQDSSDESNHSANIVEEVLEEAEVGFPQDSSEESNHSTHIIEEVVEKTGGRLPEDSSEESQSTHLVEEVVEETGVLLHEDAFEDSNQPAHIEEFVQETGVGIAEDSSEQSIHSTHIIEEVVEETGGELPEGYEDSHQPTHIVEEIVGEIDFGLRQETLVESIHPAHIMEEVVEGPEVELSEAILEIAEEGDMMEISLEKSSHMEVNESMEPSSSVEKNGDETVTEPVVSTSEVATSSNKLTEADNDEGSDFEGFEDNPDNANMDGMMSNIFGPSDDEEEFEGFAENEIEKGGDEKEEDDEEADGGEKAKGEDDSSSDEGVEESAAYVSDFDLMMQRKKDENRRKRPRNKDIDFLNDNDDLIVDLIGRMRGACEEDRELSTLHQPATKKLKMLPEVEAMLKKSDCRSAMIDCGILRAITEWLSPLPDKCLPCLPVREALIRGLLDMPNLTPEALKESGVGKAVMYLHKHPKESKRNKDRTGKLINEWSRPIFNLTSNFRSMSKSEREERDYANLPKRRNIDSEAAPKRDINKEMEGDKKSVRPGDPGWIGRARVPMPSNKDYVVRPKWNVEANQGKGGGKKEISRFEKHIRTIKEANSKKKRIAKAVPMSIEGRKL